MATRRNVRSKTRPKGRAHLAGSLIIGVAIIIAASTFGKSSYEAEAISTNTQIVAEFDTLNVPVPVEPVPAGTKVRDIRFKRVAFPRHQLPDGAILDPASFLESFTVAPLPANLPIFAVNLSLAGRPGNPVIERIPPGMRAITIRVDATSSVEGWAGSGSLVDVLLINSEGASVVAEKVKILSAERSVSPVEGNTAPSVPNTVTLLVTQEQSLAINAAIPLGKIAFALRNMQDDDNWSRRTFSAERLKNGSVVRDSSGVIRGFVSVNGEGQEQSFALSGDKWIPTETIPEGFFPTRKR
jgi:pilus assembly protein CpaB